MAMLAMLACCIMFFLIVFGEADHEANMLTAAAAARVLHSVDSVRGDGGQRIAIKTSPISEKSFADRKLLKKLDDCANRNCDGCTNDNCDVESPVTLDEDCARHNCDVEAPITCNPPCGCVVYDDDLDIIDCELLPVPLPSE